MYLPTFDTVSENIRDVIRSPKVFFLFVTDPLSGTGSTFGFSTGSDSEGLRRLAILEFPGNLFGVTVTGGFFGLIDGSLNC
jgi:hypothetical protein